MFNGFLLKYYIPLEVKKMLNEIGRIAGTIWHYLEKNHEATVTQLTREMDMSERKILMAIGWLAREEKLAFEQRRRRLYITLKAPQPDARPA